MDEDQKAAKEAAVKEAQELKAAEAAALAEKLAAETEEEREEREKREREQKEEADELYLVSHLPKQTQDYAVCMDTLGQNRRFTEEEIELSHRFAKLLRSTMLRLDR